MGNSGATTTSGPRPRTTGGGGDWSPEHYLRLLWHRKWLVLGIFVIVAVSTVMIASRLPDIYTSETVILVDPQKVPDAYVKSTVTGDIRNRLGTLSQQILSATRLQKIIETLNLYPEERKKLAREEVISRMRSDISVSVVSDFGASQDLQAFRIAYSGSNNRLVAQVTNEIASLFIEENLKAREQQATGTTEFLESELQEARKTLETQEGKLKDFKLRHVGEMPEQQAANLQILGQLQAQLQTQSDALARAQQQKNYLQALTNQTAPVVDLDNAGLSEVRTTVANEFTPDVPNAAVGNTTAGGAPVNSAILNSARAKLAELLSHYTDKHPDVRLLKKQIADEEARIAAATTSKSTVSTPTNDTATTATPATNSNAARPAPVARRAPTPPVNHVNPVLQSQLNTVDAEIASHSEEVQRLTKSISSYRARLEAVPVREQEMTELVRDYEISKSHYGQLLEKQLGAETATQLEIRQKGEKFEILDPGQVAEKPSRPNRALIDGAGGLGGLILGMLIALATEFLGMSITSPQDVTAACGLAVLEVIPVIQTRIDKVLLKKRVLVTCVSAVLVVAVLGAVLFYHNQT